MNILIDLSSRFIAEVLFDYLQKKGRYRLLISDNGTGSDDFVPDIVLTDFNTICPELISRYGDAKVLMIDTGLKKEEIVRSIALYRLSGVLSTDTDLPLFEKALRIVCEGQLWIDNETLKRCVHDAGLVTETGRLNGVSERELQIIKLVAEGSKNREIAAKLYMSEQTVKSHLNRIFRKFDVSNRSQLIAFALNNSML